MAPSEKFEFYLKLNKMENDDLHYLAMSLSLNSDLEKKNLINKIIEKFEILDTEELKKFEKLINENSEIKNKREANNNLNKNPNKNKFNYTLKKRSHNEIITNEEKEKTDINFKTIFKKKLKYDKYLNEGEKYYYIDNDNIEWEFREKKGTSSNYYFKCTTDKCTGFGMILKDDKQKNFKLTKDHNIPYLLHTYNNVNLKNKKFTEVDFDQNNWNQITFRNEYLLWLIGNNNNLSEG